MLLAYFGTQALLDVWLWTDIDNRSDLRRLREVGQAQQQRLDSPTLHGRWVVVANLAVSIVALAVLARSSGQFYARVQRAGVPKALLRSRRAVAALDADEERRIRGLLAAHGDRDSLGYFATRRDKQVVFSASGNAAVT